MDTPRDVDAYLNAIRRNVGQANLNKQASDTLFGLNITQRNASLPANTENHGYTFFTRPLMNMSYDNLAVDRVLSSLLASEEDSIQRTIRGYFDPRHVKSQYSNFTTKGVDNKLAFIPLLSNNLISLSGWPDFTLNTKTDSPGIYREAYSYVDDIPYNYETNDVVATFRNLTGDPISFMMLMWGWYIGLAYEGRIMPYPDLVMLNEIDYHTRIYRLVMDRTRTYVSRIAACGAAFPITAPIGNIFNFEGDGSQSPFGTVDDQISVNFRYMGFTYYDNILIHEFNTTVSNFNPDMRDSLRSGNMVKLKHFEKNYFQRYAYPHINEETLELEWWVDKDYYTFQIQGLTRDTVTGEPMS
jgi:hypothetical protein